MKRLLAIALLLGLGGCVTAPPIVTYVPQGGNVTYNQGVGTMSVQTREALIEMAPTFAYQSESDLPTFTLSITNTSKRELDFDPAVLQSFIDNQAAHVYSLEERVTEIRNDANRKATALAVVGVLAAAAGAYEASHGTATTNVTAVDHHRLVSATVTTKVYDPGAGALAGVGILAGTGVGIKQIQNAAGHEEEAAQAIFQHTTIAPGQTAIGQVIIKPAAPEFVNVRIVVPTGGQPHDFVFARHKPS